MRGGAGEVRLGRCGGIREGEGRLREVLEGSGRCGEGGEGEGGEGVYIPDLHGGERGAECRHLRVCAIALRVLLAEGHEVYEDARLGWELDLRLRVRVRGEGAG